MLTIIILFSTSFMLTVAIQYSNGPKILWPVFFNKTYIGPTMTLDLMKISKDFIAGEKIRQTDIIYLGFLS